jgi:putative heme iron utilization protein
VYDKDFMGQNEQVLYMNGMYSLFFKIFLRREFLSLHKSVAL